MVPDSVQIMSFAQRITRTPFAYDSERGRDAVHALAMSGSLKSLCEGAAGSSPFLAEMIAKESEWLSATLADAPENTLSGVMSAVEDLLDAELASGLRQAKRRVALLTALADLGGIWTLEEVTVALTNFADLATDKALKAAIAAEIRRGRIPGQTENDVETAAGLAVIAMGKGGAFELNYSSDIDLICLYDETRFDPEDYADARNGFVRAVNLVQNPQRSNRRWLCLPYRPAPSPRCLGHAGGHFDGGRRTLL